VKERLTGAIIFVALIVLLVPELLTGPLRSAPRAAAMAPPAGEPPLRSYTINLADDARARTAATHPSGPEQPAPLGSGAPRESASAQALSTAPAPQTPAGDAAAQVASGAGSATPPAQPSPAAPSAPAPTSVAPAPAPAAPAPAAPLSGGAWVVQLGSFASRTNAEHLAQRVRSQGFQASVSQGSSGRRLYRVRVAGAHDRAAAAQLAQKLRALGHSGTVVPK
jgi:cell division septation protein DedD